MCQMRMGGVHFSLLLYPSKRSLTCEVVSTQVEDDRAASTGGVGRWDIPKLGLSPGATITRVPSLTI